MAFCSDRPASCFRAHLPGVKEDESRRSSRETMMSSPRRASGPTSARGKRAATTQWQRSTGALHRGRLAMLPTASAAAMAPPPPSTAAGLQNPRRQARAGQAARGAHRCRQGRAADDRGGLTPHASRVHRNVPASEPPAGGPGTFGAQWAHRSAWTLISRSTLAREGQVLEPDGDRLAVGQNGSTLSCPTTRSRLDLLDGAAHRLDFAPLCEP